MYVMILCAALTFTTAIFVSAEGETLKINSADSQKITLSYTGAEALDWVGVYPEGKVPGGDFASYFWEYLEEGDGELTLTPENRNNFGKDSLEPGKYTLYFCKNDGYDVVAQQEFTIESGDNAATEVTTVAEQPEVTDVPDVSNAPDVSDAPASPKTADAVGIAVLALAAFSAAALISRSKKR